MQSKNSQKNTEGTPSPFPKKISQLDSIPQVGQWFEVLQPYHLSTGINEQVEMVSIIEGKYKEILFFLVHLTPYTLTGERIPIEDYLPEVAKSYTLIFPANLLPEERGTLKDFGYRMKRI